MSKKPSQQSLSKQALHDVRKAQAENPPQRPDNTPARDDGMIPTPRCDYPPSGAFDAEGHEPALRRSRER